MKINLLLICTNRHSDEKIIEVEKGIAKEDDTTAFLVGGGPQTAKSRTLSATNPIIRFFKAINLFINL